MSKTSYIFLKTITLGMMLIVGANQLSAQSVNNGIFFQAVARDNFSNPAKERKIYVQSSVIQTTTNGTSLLVEQFQVNTDGTGMFSISIGNGTRVGGTASGLNAIDWSQGPFFLNLKIAITPAAGNVGWDYTKEWVNIGTTSFGAVPYALYAGTAAGVDQKVNITDTVKMLSTYAKVTAVKILETSLGTKLTATDTAAMLVPYRKMVNEIIASNITSLTADAINAALNSKVNIVDSNKMYVTPSLLAARAFDPTNINNSLALKANTSDVNTSLALKATATDVTTSLATKVDKVTGKELSTNDYTTAEKTKLAAITGSNTGDQDLSAYATNIKVDQISTDVTSALALKANLASPVFTGTISGITSSMVGLGNVNNTSDASKPISTATQSALDLKLNTTGNATTATTAGNITATANTTLTSLSNLSTVGTITSGVWSGTAVAVANGGTGATTASAARTNLGLEIGTNVQAPLVAGTDYLTPTGSAASLTSFPTFNQSTSGNAATATLAGNITATSNTTITSLSNLSSVGTITSGVWSGTAVAVEKGGTGLTSLTSGYVPFGNGTDAFASNSNFKWNNIFDEDGNLESYTLGIGVTDPGQGFNTMLDVGGRASFRINSTNKALIIDGSSGYSRLYTGSLSGTPDDLILATYPHHLNQLFLKQSNGYVGINNNNPIAQLDVNGTIKASGTLTAGDVTYPNTKGTDGQVLTIDGTTGVASWAAVSTGVSSIGSILGASTANGASITSGVLNLAPADATNGGIVTTDPQTIAGAKTFNSDLTVNGLTIGLGLGQRSQNTAIGAASLSNNTSGSYNTATGVSSLQNNTSGQYNTANGASALSSNIYGAYNTSIGARSLIVNTGGSANVAIGQATMYNNLTGNNNTAIGVNALNNNTTGSQNTAIGYSADVASNSLTNATAIGSGTIVSTSNTIQLGNNDVTDVKTDANIVSSKDIKGATYNGVELGLGGGNRIDNIKLGSGALQSNTSSGIRNTAIGVSALGSNIDGSYNTANGYAALGLNTSGTGNVATGLQTMSSNTTGNFNTAMGVNALNTNNTGSQITAIGNEADVTLDGLTNATALGYGAKVTAGNTIQLGNTSVTNVNTSGTLTAGDVTYPKTHGAANQVLSTNGSGTLAWSTPAGGVNLYQKTNNSTTLTSNVQNLISLSLPAGSYLVTYTGMAYEGGNTAEYVASRIAIINPGNLGGGDAIMVNGTLNDGRAYVVHQLAITLATAGSVSVWANNIYGTTNSYLLSSRLIAVQVGSVIDQ